MFARVMHIQSKPRKQGEIVALCRESVLPVLQQQKDFHDTLLLTDRDSGKGISITLWESAADQQASNANSFLREQIGKVMSLLAGPPTREDYVAGLAD